MKKLAIIGRGTAGCYAASHFSALTDFDIELYYDPDTKVQTVGESGNLSLPESLFRNLGIHYANKDELLDATFKVGIKKSNWYKGETFFNYFPPGRVSYHFHAYKLQNLILERLKDRIKIIPEKIDTDSLDADYIMDCSGKPGVYNDFEYLTDKDDSIPVNAVHVTECPWEHPQFQTTQVIARPYGWVFGIPLANRLSVGYLYNQNINTLDEVKEDVLNVFEYLKVIPSDRTQSFDFKNYYRKKNFTDRIAYNGNSSFFLEPLEATSIWTMNFIQSTAYDVWVNNKPIDQANFEYSKNLKEIENCLMLHYFAGSIFKTEFWDFAGKRAENNMRAALKNKDFLKMLEVSKRLDIKNPSPEALKTVYGIWYAPIWRNHMDAWGLYDKIKTINNMR